MRRTIHQIVQTLNETTVFPWHGIARCSDGYAVLLFPFPRAALDLKNHNQQFVRQRKIQWKDVLASHFFHSRWNDVYCVITKIASLEDTISKSEIGHE